MLPLLAELPAPDSPMAVGWLVLTVAALAVAYNAILSIVDRYKEKKAVKTRVVDQPLEVRAAREFADRASCEKIHGALEKRMESFVDRGQYARDREEMRQELARNAAARKTNYERLEQLGCEIAASQAEVTSQGKAIAEVVQVSRETASKVEAVGGQLTVINQQVQQISNSLIVAAHERRHS